MAVAIYLEWGTKGNCKDSAGIYDTRTGDHIPKVKKLEFPRGVEVSTKTEIIGLAIVTRFALDLTGRMIIEDGRYKRIEELRHVRLVWKQPSRIPYLSVVSLQAYTNDKEKMSPMP